MKRLNLILVLAAAGLSAVAADDQSVTNVYRQEEFVAEVLQRNPEVKFYEAEIAAAKGERKAAGTLANPELNGDVGHKRARDAAGTLAGEGVAWSVGLSQTFEWPGRLGLRKAIANRQISLAELGLEKFRASLAARARTVAFASYAAREKETAANEVAQRVQALREVVVQRDPAGVTPLLEMRILEANALTAERKAVEAALEAQSANLELNLLRGERADAKVHIVAAPQNFTPPAAFEELLAAARTNSYDLQTRQIELEQQGFRVSLAKNDRWPAVTVGPFYSEERAGEKERVAGVGVSFPLPLWNRNSGNVQVANAREQQAEASLRVAHREVERELMEKVSGYSARFAALSRWRPDIIAQLREAAELGDRHYRLGAVPIATYVELQEKYLEAVEAYFDLQKEGYAAAQQVQLLTGLPLAKEAK
jgi:cobalt-zinc-cadmium efflux system outer membrane protein